MVGLSPVVFWWVVGMKVGYVCCASGGGDCGCDYNLGT